jgi:hypothetical protein
MALRRPLVHIGGNAQEVPQGDMLDPACLPGGVLLFSGTADSTAGTTAGATSILAGTGVGSLTLPAAYLVAGKSLRLTGYGLCSTLASLGTTSIQFKLGSVTVAATSALGLTALLSNVPVSWSVTLTCRAAGAAGSVLAMGSFTVGTATSFLLPATTTLATSGALALDLSWNTSVALGATMITKLALLEALN